MISAPPTLPTPAPLPTLPPINIALVRARGQQALRQAHADATRIGVGVSSEAQEIFNSLCKTYATVGDGSKETDDSINI